MSIPAENTLAGLARATKTASSPSRIAIEQTSRVSVATSSIIGWRTATIWFDDR